MGSAAAAANSWFDKVGGEMSLGNDADILRR